jgi:hypothetical protein
MSASPAISKAAGARRLATRGAVAVALALPLIMVSAPAQAATTRAGCTVTPLPPERIGTTPGGLPRVRFPTRVTCVRNRIVQILDQRYEADPPPGIAGDDLYGSDTYLRTFAAPATIVVSAVDVVTNTEPGNEEVYHRTRFRVASIDVITGWTAFENSRVLSVAI